MSNIDKRLQSLEVAAHRAERNASDAWLRSLSDQELDDLIEGFRREDPEGWARIEAMSNAELEAIASGSYA